MESVGHIATPLIPHPIVACLSLDRNLTVTPIAKAVLMQEHGCARLIGEKSPAHETEWMPEDLRTWTGPRRLVRLALESIENCVWTDRGSRHPGNPLFNQPLAATLLLYSYSSGRFSWLEIEESFIHDPEVHYICSGEIPDTSQLRYFRRKNREMLIHALSRLILKSWLVRQQKLFLGYLPDLNSEIVKQGCDEANRRFYLACQRDSIELED